MKITTLLALFCSVLWAGAQPNPLRYNFATTNANPQLTNQIRNVAKTLDLDMNANGKSITNAATVNAATVNAGYVGAASGLIGNLLANDIYSASVRGMFFGDGTWITNVNNANVIAATNTLAGVTVPTLNVKTFGALGDGAHDDTAALQAAARSMSTGAIHRVYVPSGRYLIGSPIVLTNTGFDFFGAGVSNTVIVATNANADAIQIINGAGDPRGGFMHDISIRRPAYDNTNGTGCGVFVGKVASPSHSINQLDLRRLEINEHYRGLVISNSCDVAVESCSISGNEAGNIWGLIDGIVLIKNLEAHNLNEFGYGYGGTSANSKTNTDIIHLTAGSTGPGHVTIEGVECSYANRFLYADGMASVAILSVNCDAGVATEPGSHVVELTNCTVATINSCRFTAVNPAGIPFGLFECRQNNLNIGAIICTTYTNIFSESVGDASFGQFPNVASSGGGNSTTQLTATYRSLWANPPSASTLIPTVANTTFWNDWNLAQTFRKGVKLNNGYYDSGLIVGGDNGVAAGGNTAGNTKSWEINATTKRGDGTGPFVGIASGFNEAANNRLWLNYNLSGLSHSDVTIFAADNVYGTNPYPMVTLTSSGMNVRSNFTVNGWNGFTGCITNLSANGVTNFMYFTNGILGTNTYIP